MVAAAVALMIALLASACTRHNDEGDAIAPDTAMSDCAGAPVVAVTAAQEAGEEVAIDGSASTASRMLRALYEQAALAVVERAATEHAALRIVVFEASGIGARVVLENTFARQSPDEVYNLAATNALRCWARIAIKRAVETVANKRGGSDVAGVMAASISGLRSLVATGKPATVTVLTDGCQAPAHSGPNSELIDLCAKLTAGVTPAGLLRAHGRQFALPDARGVTIVMKGIGRGRSAAGANSAQGQRLTEFWRTACLRSNARACEIGSDLP
jgi:hypothetical protein